MEKENEMENLRKIHQQDLDCIEALSEQVEALKNELQQQKLNDLQSQKQAIEQELENEKFKLFMTTPRQPLVNEEQTEEQKVKSLDEILMED